MARNYMQDIMPPDGPAPKPRRRTARPVPRPEPLPEPEVEIQQQEEVIEEPAMPERSIRSIRPSDSRLHRFARQESRPVEVDEERPRHHHPKSKRGSRSGILVAAIVALIVIGVGAFLVFFPSTSITVIPHTQVVSFDASTPFTAYPEASAAAGTIAYRVISETFEDSTVVQANGTEHAEERASGNVTVYNEYSDQPVQLIKNTRFETPEGLIFRIPASVEVPARKGTTPGSIEITLFADQYGPAYNVGPFAKMTIPGLRSSAEMYAKVYAKSSAAFSGGFSGERPAVSDAILESSKAEVRSRLQEKAQQFANTAPEDVVAFPGLMAINFESLPPTEEGSGSVRINERAVVSVPVFPSERLAQTIGQSVSASAEGQSIHMLFSEGLVATPVGTLNAADFGAAPIVFSLSGRGQLVWNVDSGALAEALAGREESAFETIIQAFPAVEEARARIMPFWRNAFPEADNIQVNVEPPPAF